MNQSFETLLQVVQRALGEVVLPAVGASDKHVIEQLHLSLAALGFMQARVPYARAFHRRELTDYIGLASTILAILSGEGGTGSTALGSAAEKAQAQLSNAEADSRDYIASARSLREAVAAIVETAGGQPYERQLDALILSPDNKTQLRARAWCEPFGFESRPQDLPAADWLMADD